MRRGDLVTVALQGEHGKPRPALVIQSDRFPDTTAAVILPITSTLIDAPLIRLDVEPTPETGLRKPMTVAISKVGPAFGRLDDTAMLAVNREPCYFAVSRPYRLKAGQKPLNQVDDRIYRTSIE